MKRYNIYFSPTGGTKRTVKVIDQAWADPAEEIDLTDPETDYKRYNFQKEDVCLIAVPSFGGRVPAVAVKHLQDMTGNGARAVMVCVYGNRAYDDTLLELEEILRSRGFIGVAAVAAVAEHSIMRQFGTGRPDSRDIQELTGFARQIKMLLESGEEQQEKSGQAGGGAGYIAVPGKRPYREYGGLPMHPRAGKKCSGCGLCAKKCPVQAIDHRNPTRTDGSKCITCMQCIAVCPEHARDLNRVVLFFAAQKMKKACGGRKENELFVKSNTVK